MANMPKKSTLSDTLRSSNQFTSAVENGRALTNAAETWLAATTECQRELIGFVSRRLEKDSVAFREIMACKNAADMTATQSRWVEETLRDYNSEFAKLMAIYTKSAGRFGHYEK